MKNLLFTFVLSFFAAFLFGQSIISGKVFDKANTPIEYANVLLHQSTDSAFVKGGLTELDGTYAFANVDAGSYFIVVSQVGFADHTITDISISAEDKSVNIPDIVLSEGLQLEEVTVSAQRPLIELKADKVIVNVEGSSVSVGNNALEVLEKSPGVIVDQDNNISLKGKQGVLILIDGKNQYISNEQLSRMLETMPANAIDKIEIIQNPSSKYDANGNAGVINIRLKKKENLGYNGNLNLGVGQGRYPKANAGVSLNYRAEKINVFGSYDYRYWKGFQEISLDRSVPVGQEFTYFNQNSEMINNSVSNNFKLGLDYYLSDKTTIGVLGRGNIGDWDNTNNNITNIKGYNGQGFDRSNTLTDATEDWEQLAGNINVKHNFSDQSGLNIDLDYSRYDNPTFAEYENYFYTSTGSEALPEMFLNNENIVMVDILATKIDYNTQLKNGISLEVGTKYSEVSTKNSTLFMQNVNEEWVSDVNISNEFQYDEEILAGYVNSSKTIGKVTLQGGLRVEHTNSNGFSRTLDQTVTRGYTDFFPSASISHSINEKHSLSYSYSRRIDRPTYRNLNPFIYFLDQFTFQKGNPFLNPQITNSYGVNYGLGNSLFLSANYSRTSDLITEVIGQNDESQQTFQTMVNLDSYDNYSLNATAPIIVSNKWTSRWSVTSFYNHFNSDFSNGTVDNSLFSYHINMSNDFTLSQKLSAEFTGFYQSPLVWGVFEIKPRYSFDLGFSYKVMDGKGNIKVNAKDIFGTLDNDVSVRQNTINLDVHSRWEARRVQASFTYNFGNQKVKNARRRSTATSDEENRVSRGNN